MNETKEVQFKLEWDCEIITIADSQKIAEKDLKERLKAIVDLAKIYKLDMTQNVGRREHYSGLPIKEYEWHFTFKLIGYGKSFTFTKLPIAIHYFCHLYGFEVKQEKFTMSQIRDNNLK